MHEFHFGFFQTDLRLRKDVPEERESDGELTEEGTKKMDVSDIVQVSDLAVECWCICLFFPGTCI